MINNANFSEAWYKLTMTCLVWMNLIFLISQKQILDQLHHFTSKNWDEHQKWCAEQCLLATKRILLNLLLISHGRNWNFLIIALTMSMIFVLKSNANLENWESLSRPTIFTWSTRKIDYTHAFFPNTMTSTLVLVFTGPLAFPKHMFKLPLLKLNSLLPISLNSVIHYYSIISNTSCNILDNLVVNGTPCSIVVSQLAVLPMIKSILWSLTLVPPKP